MVHGSTDAALGGLGRFASNASSPCSNGVSLRQNVQCCVLIAIMYCPTLGTSPLTDGKRQSFDDVPAVVAPLAGRKEAINLGERLPIAVALVLQESRKLPHRGVTECASEAVIPNHAAHVQIFDADRVEPTHDVCRDLLHVVESRVRYLRLYASDFETLKFPAITSFLAPCEDTLGFGEFAGFLLEQSWVGDVLAVGQCGESVDAEIDADGLAGLRQRGDRLVEDQRHKVPTIAALGYRRSGGGTHEGSRPVDIKTSEFSDGQVAVDGVPLEGAQRVLSGLWAVLFLERRVAGALVEEVVERSLEMSECLLRRDAGDLFKPRGLRLLLQLRKLRRGGVVVDVLSCVVSIGASAERPIVNEPASSEGARQYSLLRWSGIEPKSVTHLHNSEYTLVMSQEQQRKGSAIPPSAKSDGLLARVL